MMREHVGLDPGAGGLGGGGSTASSIVAPHPLNLVCVALRAGDEATDALAHAANASGEALFTRSVADGRSFVRFCVGGRTTQRRHVEAGWGLLQSLANDLV